MTETSLFIDHYETLQLSPSADFETIERVYRLLAKKYHPDNRITADVEKFRKVVDAYRILSDPGKRASYDANYEEGNNKRWQMFYADVQRDDPQDDQWMQHGILSLLYVARRRETENPGVGIYELERVLGAPEQYLEFHLWYLKEKAWIQRLDNGQFAITVNGVDEIRRNGIHRAENQLLTAGTKK